MGQAAVVHDSEWEYEYDASETEHFYFTLDLTTHVPDALVRKYDTAADSHANIDAAPKSSSGDGLQNEDVTTTATTTTGESLPNVAEARSRPRTTLQILDLHTKNPLVKFDHAIYSCYWSTDLGTQFHISQAGLTPNPRRAGTVLDVIGLSQTRLIGKPVNLTQKGFRADEEANSAAPDEHDTVESSGGQVDADADADADAAAAIERAKPAASSSKSATQQPLVIPRELCKNLAAETHASFLERLSEIKLKKGETDPVPIFSIKYHREPDNKDELKKRAQAADAAKQKDDEEAVSGERARKRRKRLTAAEKGTRPTDAPSTCGRHGREAIGARVGFEGQAPGALWTKKKQTRRKPAEARESSDEHLSDNLEMEVDDPDADYAPPQ